MSDSNARRCMCEIIRVTNKHYIYTMFILSVIITIAILMPWNLMYSNYVAIVMLILKFNSIMLPTCFILLSIPAVFLLLLNTINIFYPVYKFKSKLKTNSIIRFIYNIDSL